MLPLLYGILCFALYGAGRAIKLKPSLAAFLCLSFLPLAFTSRGFLPGQTLAPTASLAGVPPWSHSRSNEPGERTNPLLFDALSQFEPWRQAAREDLLFNRHQGSGAALLGNAQSAALFPLEIVARIPAPPKATVFVQAGKLLIAGWGFFLLLRLLALREASALIGSFLFVGSGFLQFWRLHPISTVAAISPWLILATIRLMRRTTPAAAVGVAVAASLAVSAGHPETLAHLLLLAPACLLYMRRHRWAKTVAWLAVSAALAVGLSLPVLVPVVQNLLASDEWSRRVERNDVDQIELPLHRALPRALPVFQTTALGDPLTGDWSGPENILETAGGSVGVAPLALLALLPGLRRRRREVVLWLLLGLFLLGCAIHLPLVSRPLGWVPLLRTSLLKRLQFEWVFALSLACAMLTDGALRRKRFPGVLAAAALLSALVSSICLATGRLDQRAWLDLLACAVIGAALSLRVGPRTRAAAIAAAVLVPRVALFSAWVPPAAESTFYPRTPAIDFVAAQIGSHRVAGLGGALLPDSAAFFGLEDVRAYDPVSYAGYARLLRYHHRAAAVGWATFSDPGDPLLRLLGVKFVFAASRSKEPGARVAYRGRDATVYEVVDPAPRVFVPRSLVTVDDSDEALRTLSTNAYTPSIAVMLGSPQALRPNGEAVVGEISVESRAIRTTVTAISPTLVATNQPRIPGWRAYVDDEPTHIETTDTAFIAARVRPGFHRLVFRYEPAYWASSWLLFAATAALALVLLTFGRSISSRQNAAALQRQRKIFKATR